jgi:hypothetical protein
MTAGFFCHSMSWTKQRFVGGGVRAARKSSAELTRHAFFYLREYGRMLAFCDSGAAQRNSSRTSRPFVPRPQTAPRHSATAMTVRGLRLMPTSPPTSFARSSRKLVPVIRRLPRASRRSRRSDAWVSSARYPSPQNMTGLISLGVGLLWLSERSARRRHACPLPPSHALRKTVAAFEGSRTVPIPS